jgi:hypothetical protein
MRRAMPAFATTASSAPWRCSTTETTSLTASVLVTSSRWNWATPPFFAISAATCRPSLSRTSVTTTVYPALAKAKAVARPMPMPLPVINTHCRAIAVLPRRTLATSLPQSRDQLAASSGVTAIAGPPSGDRHSPQVVADRGRAATPVKNTEAQRPPPSKMELLLARAPRLVCAVPAPER